jgi:hypothetical protein
VTTQGLAAFGVRASDPRSYLLDIDRGIIIAEGAPAAVAAKVKDWEEVAPGRYRAVAGDDADPGALYEWDQFKARNQHWVIR